MKAKKLLSKAQLHLKACHLLKLPPSWIVSVIPNSGKTKYFIHYMAISIKGKPLPITQLVDAKDLEKSKPCR